MKSMYTRFGSTFVLAAALIASGAWAADDPAKAPMPQTRGMQGMDPALHEKWAKEGKQDPYKDCKLNEKAAAAQARHPMPDTRGMKDMDPKAHVMDCPDPVVEKSDAPKHVHK
jgi:hypothetical protein